ncbi:MAG: hypothetical protein IT363_15775 [Methanoregulaceae archaeon]|nr:hypothetical protein [Methanoregulaceae archaeon]
MRSALVVFGCIALLATISAQETLKRRPVTAVPGAITQSEASVVFSRIERTFSRLTRISRTLPAMPKSNNPTTRAEVLTRMIRLVDEFKGEFRFTPKRIPYDGSALTVNAPARAQVERLIAWGFVAKTSPLVTGVQETLTPVEFGDAIGLFITRMADLTHTPSPKWSPYMSGGN